MYTMCIRQTLHEKDKLHYMEHNHHSKNTGSQFIISNSFSRHCNDGFKILEPVQSLFHVLLSKFSNDLTESQRVKFMALLQYMVTEEELHTIPDHAISIPFKSILGAGEKICFEFVADSGILVRGFRHRIHLSRNRKLN